MSRSSCSPAACRCARTAYSPARCSRCSTRCATCTRSGSRSKTQTALRLRRRRGSSAVRISASSNRAPQQTSSFSTTGSKSSVSCAEGRRVSWLEEELREQAAVLERLLRSQAETAREIASVFARDDVRYILIASRGSSSNAARYAQYLLGRAHRVPVMFATPSLYTIYEQPPRLEGAVVLGISQSGASPDVAAVLAEARRQGRPTVALTNAPDSPLAREADSVLLLEAGDERAVAATKTYMNSLGAIAMLFAAVDGTVADAELHAMPGLLEQQIALSVESAPPLDEYKESVGATVVARGVNYGTAFEIALKIRELSGLVVEAYSPADLMHGPIAAIREG